MGNGFALTSSQSIAYPTFLWVFSASGWMFYSFFSGSSSFMLGVPNSTDERCLCSMRLTTLTF